MHNPIFKSITCQLNPLSIDWAYKSLTTCYHPDSYGDELAQEVKLAKIVEVLRKGHFSIARMIDLFFVLELIPHDVAMQVRTHKFLDCQITSQRYTGQHLLEGDVDKLVDGYFYFRAPGKYPTRNGVEIIDSEIYEAAKLSQACSIVRYQDLVSRGCELESARSVLAQGIKQSMTVRTNLQGFLDFAQVRSTKDVQFECRKVVEEMIRQLPEHLDAVVDPWMKKNYGKNTSTF